MNQEAALQPKRPWLKVQIRRSPGIRVGRLIVFRALVGEWPPKVARGVLASYFTVGPVAIGWVKAWRK